MAKKKLSTAKLVGVVAVITILTIAASYIFGPVGLTENDNGSAIELANGQGMVVTLESNPTTGYSWEIAEIDSAILKQTGDSGFVQDSNLIGAGGKETFNFNAIGTGTTQLQLIYHRSWETGVEPLKIFTVTVTVK